MHDIMVGTFVLIAILLAMTSNYWLSYVSHMTYLFKDNVTIGLIATVVVLLTLYDCKIGIAFAFVVAVVAVNMQHEAFEAFGNFKATVTTRPPRTPVTTKALPVTTRPPKRKEGFQNIMPEQGAKVIAEKIEKQMVLPTQKVCSVAQKDFNTYSSGKDYHGFDVAGCRYDLENRTQNNTIYGPPLSWCATYGSGSKLPVPFYPLNG